MAVTLNASTSTGLVQTADTSGDIALQNNGTTAVTVTGGNVGIGTTSPAFKFDVRGSSQALINASSPTSWVSVDSGISTHSMYMQVNTSASDTRLGAYTNHPLLFVTNNTERGRFDTSGNFQFNSGYGSVATAYGCRAWVNFNGTGTVAIRASGNVTSITDNGTGDYTINFTTGMPDNNYACVLSGMRDADNNGSLCTTALKSGSYGTTVATGSIRVIFENTGGTKVDPLMCTASIFR